MDHSKCSGEYVTITLKVKHTYQNTIDHTAKDLYEEKRISVPVGSTVCWTIIIAYDETTKNFNFADKWMQYPSGTWKNNSSTVTEGYVTTITYNFVATVAGEAYVELGYHTGPITITQTGTASTTLSLRSTTRTATRTLRSTPRNHEVVDTTGATDMGTFVLNTENGWQNIHYELPKYSTDGKYVYTYFVQEITEGYDVNYTNNGGLTEGTITITNHKQVPTTMDMLVNKAWVDESGNKYLLLADMPRYFKLFDAEYDVTASVPGLSGATLEGEYIKLVTPMGKSGASFTLTALPIGGDYSIKEYVLVNGAYTEVTDYESVRDGSTITSPTS